MGGGRGVQSAPGLLAGTADGRTRGTRAAHRPAAPAGPHLPGGPAIPRVTGPAEQALATLCRSEQTTPFVGLLAAFATVLHRLSGQDDILIGSPYAGRSRPETEHLIGFFVNTVVLRADLSGQPTFRDLLHQVRTRTREAHAHQDVPFQTGGG